jgi:endonuclease YncB( thermonuclease family)
MFRTMPEDAAMGARQNSPQAEALGRTDKANFPCADLARRRKWASLSSGELRPSLPDIALDSPFIDWPSAEMAIPTRFLLVILLAVLAPAGAGFADGGPPAGLAPEEGRFGVVEVIDGDTLVLDDGRQVRLVGIQAPRLPLGRAGIKAWPLGEEAKATLGGLTLDRELTLAYGGRRVDRHGRALAQLYDASGNWIQGKMLEAGMARVYGFADNRALLAEMLALERTARRARRGIWRHPFYGVRTPEEAAEFIGGFELVEGQVLNAAVVRGRGYLNFGADWKTDFTVTLAPKVRRRFAAEGLDIEAYEGRRLRVRGWIESFNGPMIEVTHAEQIEVFREESLKGE